MKRAGVVMAMAQAIVRESPTPAAVPAAQAAYDVAVRLMLPTHYELCCYFRGALNGTTAEQESDIATGVLAFLRERLA